MDIAKWAEIHRLKKVEGLSNRAIAREIGCHRKTVAKALKIENPLVKEKKEEIPSIIDPVCKLNGGAGVSPAI